MATGTEFKYLEDIVLSKLRNVNSSNEILNKIKLHFKDKINSKRTFERINTFEELFNVLKKRNEICFNKTDAYKITLNVIDDKASFKESEISNLRNEFVNLSKTTDTNELHCGPSTQLLSKEQQNVLQEPHINIGTKKYEAYSLNNIHWDCKSEFSKRKEFEKSVMLQVSERIGSKWRNLARYLDITETIIDQIEIKYNLDLKEKAYQILKMSQSELDFHNWKVKLTHALEKVRRKDLRDWIEENYARERYQFN